MQGIHQGSPEGRFSRLSSRFLIVLGPLVSNGIKLRICHCEGRSPEAILERMKRNNMRLLRFARNDKGRPRGSKTEVEAYNGDAQKRSVPGACLAVWIMHHESVVRPFSLALQSPSIIWIQR